MSINDLGCFPLLTSWADHLAGAWNRILGTRKIYWSAAKGHTAADNTAAGAAKEWPVVKLHTRDDAMEDLATAEEYPHRFYIRPESTCDQVEWEEAAADGTTSIHMSVKHRLCSQHSRELCYMQIHNTSPHSVRMLWLDYQGNEVAYDIIPPGGSVMQQTFLTHPWVVREVATCTRLLLNSREAFIPSEAEHKAQVAQLLARQAQQQQQGTAAAQDPPQQQQHVAAGEQQQQQQQQQGDGGPVPVTVLVPFRGCPVFEVVIAELPQLMWTKETHGLFPQWFKSSILSLLLSHQQQQQQRAPEAAAAAAGEAQLSDIPAELLALISSMAAPFVPQSVHYPPHGRSHIKPARLPEPPTPAAAAAAAPVGPDVAAAALLQQEGAHA